MRPEGGAEQKGRNGTEDDIEPFRLLRIGRQSFGKGHKLNDHHRQPEQHQQAVDRQTEAVKQRLGGPGGDRFVCQQQILAGHVEQAHVQMTAHRSQPDIAENARPVEMGVTGRGVRHQTVDAKAGQPLQEDAEEA